MISRKLFRPSATGNRLRSACKLHNAGPSCSLPMTQFRLAKFWQLSIGRHDFGSFKDIARLKREI
jgi:hypothetical protein